MSISIKSEEDADRQVGSLTEGRKMTFDDSILITKDISLNLISEKDSEELFIEAYTKGVTNFVLE